MDGHAVVRVFCREPSSYEALRMPIVQACERHELNQDEVIERVKSAGRYVADLGDRRVIVCALDHWQPVEALRWS